MKNQILKAVMCGAVAMGLASCANVTVSVEEPFELTTRVLAVKGDNTQVKMEGLGGFSEALDFSMRDLTEYSVEGADTKESQKYSEGFPESMAEKVAFTQGRDAKIAISYEDEKSPYIQGYTYLEGIDLTKVKIARTAEEESMSGYGWKKEFYKDGVLIANVYMYNL